MRRSMMLMCGLVVLLSACNTMRGVGQDMQAGGRALEESAR